MVVTNDAGVELVTYSLGSCLGVTVYDPLKKVGGLLHLMLPDSSIDPVKAQTVPFMFVDTGVPRLFQAFFKFGGERWQVVIKVVGGAQFLDPERRFNIGERNIQALEGLLTHNGLTMHARDLGGFNSRTVRFNVATGEVVIQSPGNKPLLL